MKLSIKKTFLKDIEKVTEPQKSEVKKFLEQLSTNPHLLNNFRNIKRLQKTKKGNFFRVRFGDYRLGYEKRHDEIIIYRVLHRKDMYRYFP
jgi:mRNA interferase RelE/StbE